MKCCCGKYDLEDGEPFISNTTRHEVIGYDNFCGPEVNHTVRDLKSSLMAAHEKNKRLTDALITIRDHELNCGCSRGSFMYGCGKCRIKREIIAPVLTD